MAFLSSSPPCAPSQPAAWHTSNVFGDVDPSGSQRCPPSSPFGPSLKPPRPAGGLFGAQQPRRTTSSGSEGSHCSRRSGQLSPSFDQTFQSSMNISVTDIQPEEEAQEEHSSPGDAHSGHLQPNHQSAASASPCAMEVSPLPSQPAQVYFSQQAMHLSSYHPQILSPITNTHQRTSTSNTSSRSTENSPHIHKSFDQSFFAKLASHGSNATSLSRSRTRSADLPLSSKNVNVPTSSTSSVFSDKAAPVLPRKKPYSLLRTSSARPALHSSNSSSAAATSDSDGSRNPFKLSPRPSAFLERAHSDSTLAFGGTFPKIAQDGRKPSHLGRETSTTRPSLVAYGSSAIQGRKISGSGRVRSALPKEWQPKGDLKPPPLPHARSAPLVKPADWATLEYKANSDSFVPTRKSLASSDNPTSKLAQVYTNLSSPTGMDIDSSSPHHLQQASQQGMAGSPGLGDLFEADGGMECPASSSSPASASASSPPPDQPSQITNRKRGIQDADSSFNSQLSSSPVPCAASGAILPGSSPAPFGTNNPGSIGKGHPPRLLHRATSALSLGAASRRRGSGKLQSNSTGSASTSSSFLATLAAAASENDEFYTAISEAAARPGYQQRHTLALSGSTLLSRDNSGSSRHRKMSRGADGKPHLLKSGRRSYSMCDSEFYASPPLGQNDAPGQIDYFGQAAQQAGLSQKTVGAAQHQQQQPDEELEEVLHEDVLSPPRKALAPLNSYQPSPEASFTCGFGHKEAQGKILPCFPVKEDGLMRITADTLNDLLAGSYDDHIDQYVIIDCRFEYEYQGGHVEGAINLGTEKSVEKFLLEAGSDGNHLYETPNEMPAPSKSGEVDQTGNSKKTILVFHCEFSTKRAPTLAKYLRSRDRALNHAAYPSVHFPELYILQGGYAECWKRYPDRCEPRGYTPMDDPRHLAARANDLGEMRRKRMGVRAKSYTFGEGMFANKQQVQIPSKHLSGINFKPASSSGLALSSFTAASVTAAASGPTSSSSLNGAVGKTRSSFSANIFNVLNTKLSIHEEEHDDEEYAAGSSAELEGERDHSFSNTRHGNAVVVEGDNNSSPCGPMLGAGASLALGGMSLGDSPCQSSKPSKLARPGMMPLQPTSTARGLFKPRGMQRASTTIGANFLTR